MIQKLRKSWKVKEWSRPPKRLDDMSTKNRWKCLVFHFLHLESDELIFDHNVLGQEVSTDGGLVLSGKSLVHILVHQRGLTHAVWHEIYRNQHSRDIRGMICERHVRCPIRCFQVSVGRRVELVIILYFHVAINPHRAILPRP